MAAWRLSRSGKSLERTPDSSQKCLDKPFHPRQLCCASIIDKDLFSLSRWGRCVCVCVCVSAVVWTQGQDLPRGYWTSAMPTSTQRTKNSAAQLLASNLWSKNPNTSRHILRFTYIELHISKNKLPRVISQPTYNTWQNEVIFEHEKELHDLPVALLKVKLSLYRPRWYPRATGGWGSQYFLTIGTRRWRGQPYEPAAFTHFC